MSRYNVGGNEAELLPNKLGLTDTDDINAEEFIGFTEAEHWAIDGLSVDTTFSLEYLYKLHRKALWRLYEFAGRLRTVNMSKSGFAFPAAEFLPANLQDFEHAYLDPINQNTWDEKPLLDHLAALHAELLYLHPFREGNGRIIRLFTKLIYLAKIGKELDFALIAEGNNFDRYVKAVQQAARGEHSLMQELFREMQS